MPLEWELPPLPVPQSGHVLAKPSCHRFLHQAHPTRQVTPGVPTSLLQSSDSITTSPDGFPAPVGLSPTRRGLQHPLGTSNQLHAAEDTAGAKVMLLCCVLLAAAGGLHLCCGLLVLEGVKGQSLAFPTPYPMSMDIARVTWRFHHTHIAEAKPREMKFTVDYLPDFHGRLFIHLTNLSLEIRPLKLEDRGRYEVVLDTLSDPTNPKTFSYILKVYGDPPDDDAEGLGRSTVGPRRTTEPQAGDTSTRSADGGSGWEPVCGVQDNYCVLKGYLVAAVFGLLMMLVAAVHIMTRDHRARE